MNNHPIQLEPLFQKIDALADQLRDQDQIEQTREQLNHIHNLYWMAREGKEEDKDEEEEEGELLREEYLLTLRLDQLKQQPIEQAVNMVAKNYKHLGLTGSQLLWLYQNRDRDWFLN